MVPCCCCCCCLGSKLESSVIARVDPFGDCGFIGDTLPSAPLFTTRSTTKNLTRSESHGFPSSSLVRSKRNLRSCLTLFKQSAYSSTAFASDPYERSAGLTTGPRPNHSQHKCRVAHDSRTITGRQRVQSVEASTKKSPPSVALPVIFSILFTEP